MNHLTLLRDETNTAVRIVDSAKAMTETLFKPLEGGHTADGYILKRSKRRLDFMVGQQLYAINRHGCLLHGSPSPEGIWWQFQLDFTYKSGKDFADKVAVGRDNLGIFFK